MCNQYCRTLDFLTLLLTCVGPGTDIPEVFPGSVITAARIATKFGTAVPAFIAHMF